MPVEVGKSNLGMKTHQLDNLETRLANAETNRPGIVVVGLKRIALEASGTEQPVVVAQKRIVQEAFGKEQPAVVVQEELMAETAGVSSARCRSAA